MKGATSCSRGYGEEAPYQNPISHKCIEEISRLRAKYGVPDTKKKCLHQTFRVRNISFDGGRRKEPNSTASVLLATFLDFKHRIKHGDMTVQRKRDCMC